MRRRIPGPIRARRRPGARPLVRGLALSAAVTLATGGAAQADPAPGIDLGASVRLRGESADAAFLGPPTSASSDVLLTRVLANVSAYSAQGSGAFVQLGWHDEAGREPGPAPTDVDGVDVQQAYVDLNLADAGRLRVGRQEVVLGSARLVGVRESPNVRRSFDGATLTLDAGAWRLRLLALATVTNSPGAFDDHTNRGVRLDGVYATREPGAAGPGLDVYALHYRNSRARYSIGRGRERRWSFGTRLFGARGPLDYNVEAIAQTGTFATRSIRAWTIASDTGYTWRRARFAPRIGVKANVTSGDRDAGDGRLETFDPLFPNLAYFSEAATIAPQNHADVQVSATLRLADDWTARVGFDRFWRTTAHDAVYRANGSPYVVPGTDRNVARESTLDVTWRPRPHVEIKASVVHWRPAAALEASGARETWFGMTSVLVRR